MAAVVALCLAAIVALCFAAEARAADAWRPVPQSCVSYGHPACAAIRAASGTWQIAIAPGGRHAYAIAWDPDNETRNGSSLLIFDRDPATGQLTQRGAGGCLSETGSGGRCVRARGLQQPTGIVVSPDGNQVYVATNAVGGVATFDRNPSNGDLTQKDGPNGCISDNGTSPNHGAACADGRAMASAGTVAISPDGRTVVLGTGPLAILLRDPATGVLRQPAGEAGCMVAAPAEGCAVVRGLAPAPTVTRQTAFSPDGRSLYVPNGANGSLLIFDRDPATGLVAAKDGPAGCLGPSSLGGTCTVEPKLAEPRAVSVSPHGTQVYVSVADGMLAFARAADGRVSLQSCVNATGSGGCSAGRNVIKMTFSGVSPDGQAIVAANDPSGYGFSIFEHDALGNLVQARDGCVTTDGAGDIRGTRTAGVCGAQPAAAGYGTVVFADDGSFIAGSYHTHSLVSFKRDFYPVCQSQTISVTRNTAASVPLACGDRNGDPLSYEIRKNPISGSLGAVDQAAARVFYNPFSGFLGTDSFAYRAIANGLASEEATATLNVVPPPPPPPAKPKTVTSRVSYTWSYGKVRFTIRQLIVRNLPEGAKFTIKCFGKRCPYKSKTIKRSRKSTMNVLNAKALKRKVTFRAKQRIEFWISAPGMNTKVLRFKLRPNRAPKDQRYCVPLGAKKVRRSC